MVVNFKGFVANQGNNTGEDRGPSNQSPPLSLLERYSLAKGQKVYEVVVEQGNKSLARMKVELKPPTWIFGAAAQLAGRIKEYKTGQS